MKNIASIAINSVLFTVKVALSIIAMLGIFTVFTIYQNNSIVVTKHKIKDEKIPNAFNGYKIIQLSDIHNDMYGKTLSSLVKKVKKESPDIIVLTGDLVDANRYSPERTLTFLKEIKDIAPIYFVYGNHDFAINGDIQYERLLEDIKGLGINILNSKNIRLTKDGEHINLLGIQDPSTTYLEFNEEDLNCSYEDRIKRLIDIASSNIDMNNTFNILLSHRPEYFDTYVEKNIDLALTGHAHGGQIRIPFIGGLYAPGQGMLPKYTSGLHEKNDTRMIISRGLGNSRFPIRVLNTPEIISVTLQSDN